MAKSLDVLKAKLEAHRVDVKTFTPLKDLPDPVATLTVKGGDPAIKAWRGLRELVPETWHWPLLLGAPDELGFIGDGDHDEPSEAILARAATLKPDPQAWYEEEYGSAVSGGGEAVEGVRWREHAAESWTIPFEILTRKPHREVVLALFPTQAPWEVPVYLRFGNWNACPAPERHASLMKRWSAEFGAEPVGITHDVIEMRVTRPPSTKEAARALARDQYAYCSDIVEQGVGSIEALAATLYKAPTWYFWWD